MKRRDFLRAAGGSAAAAATAATGVASAQEGNETSGGGTATATGTATGNETAGNETAGTATTAASGGGGGGPTKTVTVGPGGSLVFTPGTEEPLQITPGTTVNFVWESDNHNIVVDSTPEGATWEGTEGGSSVTYDTGHEYSHTFNTLGTYEYACEPHRTAGMVATIEVVETIQTEGGGEKELHDLGVPIQAHWVGASTLLAIFVTIVYSFYILKYGESPNTGNTGGK